MVDVRILLNRLWGLGIKDRDVQVLMSDLTRGQMINPNGERQLNIMGTMLNPFKEMMDLGLSEVDAMAYDTLLFEESGQFLIMISAFIDQQPAVRSLFKEFQVSHVKVIIPT